MGRGGGGGREAKGEGGRRNKSKICFLKMANGFDTFNSPTNHYRISSSREILASVGLI